MVLLSIAINTWPGTDFYRFALLLETYIHRPTSINDYLELSRILEGWIPRERKVPSDKFRGDFSDHNFTRVLPSKPDELEMILAMDGDINNAPVEMNKELENYFIDFCKSINIHYQVLHKSKIGVCGMRNSVMQTFKGDYLMFKDDDDFSACLEDLYIQAKKLKELGMGTNDPSYWDIILNKEYLDVFQLQRDLWKYQRKPVIAMIMTNVRIKNVWGSKENPFSKVSIPIDTSQATLIDRPSFFSMNFKFFSREAIPLLSNSINLGSLEDSRSFHNQEWPQKAFYIFRDERYKFLNDGYEAFKKHIKSDVLSNEEFDLAKEFWYWVNNNLLPFKYIQLSMNKTSPNIEAYERIRPYFLNMNICSGAYLFPSGNYSSNSWSWASVIGTLEAFRNMHKQVDFTILDLQRLHKFITTCIKTELLSTNCDCAVHCLNDDPDCIKIRDILYRLVNYKYIYWTAIVNKKQDWDMFTEKISELKSLLDKIENKVFTKHNDADRIQETPIHPNTSIEMEIIVDGETIKKLISLSNAVLVHDVDLLRTNYTERFIKTKSLNGGDTEEDRDTQPIVAFLDDTKDIPVRVFSDVIIVEVRKKKFITHRLILFILILCLVIFIVRFLIVNNGSDNNIKQRFIYSR